MTELKLYDKFFTMTMTYRLGKMKGEFVVVIHSNKSLQIDWY